MKTFLKLALVGTMTLAGCGDPPPKEHLIDGKSTLWGIGLNCAARDQTCGTIWTFPGIPWTWCGCTDYFSYSKPQTVKIKVGEGENYVDVTWPGQDHLNAILPGNPVAQRIALDLELSAAVYPNFSAAFKALTPEQKLDLILKAHPVNPQAIISAIAAVKM